MSIRDDFDADVQTFMNNYTLYLPGGGQDGGKVDFDDPAYSAYRLNANPIMYPTVISQAAWKLGVKPHHVNLVLKLSRAYKMAATGRQVPDIQASTYNNPVMKPMTGAYEIQKEGLKGLGTGIGADAQNSTLAAKNALKKAKLKIDGDEWFDCYFLPWTNGRIAQMQLDQNANYFFTATMNGCSFHVSGNVQSPVVRHLNDAQPGDDTGAVVTKQDHKNRYQGMIGAGGVNEALLSKYTPTNFAGHSATYRLRQAEINARPNLNIADLLNFVIGERDTGTGNWSFYYQRCATVSTQLNVAVLKPITKAVPTNPYQALRKAVGKGYNFELEVKFKKERQTVFVNHKITQCARLQFP